MQSILPDRKSLLRKLSVAAVALAFIIPAHTASAQLFSTIKRFTGGANGVGPTGPLAAAPDGAVYGVTTQGGATGNGTVFRLVRNGTVWTHTVIHSFAGGADGSFPEGGLVRASDGNLYGTTGFGGIINATCELGCGTVFRLRPNANGTFTKFVIHRFGGNAQGRLPTAGLTLFNGSLYGTTSGGGTAGSNGIVFRLTPNAALTVWTKSVLWAFRGASFGSYPQGAVTFRNGVLYGTTERGGLFTGSCSQNGNGCGTIYRLSGGAAAPWTHTVLYRFRGDGFDDGTEPSGPLTLAGSVLYGTTQDGGADSKGTVYSFTLNAAGTAGTERVLYSFRSGADGSGPEGVVLRAGHLVGATESSGTGSGIVFALTRNGTIWTETIIKRFSGGADGGSPEGPVVLGPAGRIYGATAFGGGASDSGTIFELFRS